jgi:hypothetical protein
MACESRAAPSRGRLFGGPDVIRGRLPGWSPDRSPVLLGLRDVRLRFFFPAMVCVLLR